MSYYKYSQYLRDIYGEKVYKIPVNLPGTCPNRDGTIGTGGCIFCGAIGTGYESQPNTLSVRTQLENNIAYIGPKYKAKKYIAYFQNYTGMYLSIELFKKAIRESLLENIVGITISTRPDWIPKSHLEFLSEIQGEGIAVEIELGLQSININTLLTINRGHGVAEFVSAVMTIKKYGFTICTHLIGNLPWDTEHDFYEAGLLLSVLGVDGVKIHSLYILENTELGKWYNEDHFDVLPSDAYIDRVIHFLRIIRPDMSVQRLFARAPSDETLFCNWGMSWRRLQNILEARMKENGYQQGDLYLHTGGNL